MGLIFILGKRSLATEFFAWCNARDAWCSVVGAVVSVTMVGVASDVLLGAAVSAAVVGAAEVGVTCVCSSSVAVVGTTMCVRVRSNNWSNVNASMAHGGEEAP